LQTINSEKGRSVYQQACRMKLEGIVSKRIDAPYQPGDRGF
jgi:ATP-dependent DNA ligase